MALLNYTTSISAEKTVSEIKSKLAKAGAHQILHEYDPEGNVSALSFRIMTKFGNIAYRLPSNISAVEKILQTQHRNRVISRKHSELDQASRVGWRILKDWVEAQLAWIETGMVTVEQVFLPYAQNESGQTVYEYYLENRFNTLALPCPQKVIEIRAAPAQCKEKT